MSLKNRRIVLVSRPDGAPKADNFQLESSVMPEPEAGEMLVRNLWLSIDPYMRGRMNEGESYAPGVALGDVMVGGTVSVVVKSRLAGFNEGDYVSGWGGWQDYAVLTVEGSQKLDPAAYPLTLALGTLGMPGLTAYVGLFDHGLPKEGETVVVSAAAGAVGSVVGQLARVRKCRVVGIAGGRRKCDYVVDELGFDACVDYKSAGFRNELVAACPTGIDVYFDNVGGTVTDACLGLVNVFGRIVLCGAIAHYNDGRHPQGPDRLPGFLLRTITQRWSVTGFIISDHWHRTPDFLEEAVPLVRNGRIKYREDIVDGLENAPNALIGLLEGRNFGKLLVRLFDN